MQSQELGIPFLPYLLKDLPGWWQFAIAQFGPNLCACLVDQLLPILLLPLPFQQALVFGHRENDHVRLASALDYNGFLTFYGLPHQLAKANASLGSTHHTPHTDLPLHQSINSLLDAILPLSAEKSNSFQSSFRPALARG
jgi:hypothetical protein